MSCFFNFDEKGKPYFYWTYIDSFKDAKDIIVRCSKNANSHMMKMTPEVKELNRRCLKDVESLYHSELQLNRKDK